MSKVSVKCTHCGKLLAFEATEQMYGKTVTITCSNPSCRNKMNIELRPKEVHVPSQPNKDETEVGNETQIGAGVKKDLTLCLDVLPNEFTQAQRFMLNAEYNTIGRRNSSGPEYKPDVEIATTDKTVSRIHAVIQKRRNGMYALKNLKGLNGTFINKKPLEIGQEIYVGNGDIISLGNHLSIKVTLK